MLKAVQRPPGVVPQLFAHPLHANASQTVDICNAAQQQCMGSLCVLINVNALLPTQDVDAINLVNQHGSEGVLCQVCCKSLRPA